MKTFVSTKKKERKFRLFQHTNTRVKHAEILMESCICVCVCGCTSGNILCLLKSFFSVFFAFLWNSSAETNKRKKKRKHNPKTPKKFRQFDLNILFSSLDIQKFFLFFSQMQCHLSIVKFTFDKFILCFVSFIFFCFFFIE